MVTKRTFDREGHAHFVTFSCYRRRRLLDHDRAKKVVLGVLNSQLTRQDGRCVGFVVMPDHVHAIIWFPMNLGFARIRGWFWESAGDLFIQARW